MPPSRPQLRLVLGGPTDAAAAAAGAGAGAGAGPEEPAPADEGTVATGAGPASVEALYRRYAPHVAAIGFRLLGRDAEVDDLVQEVFVEAVRGVARVRDPEAIKGWLSIVAVRIARKKLRMRRVRGFLGMDEAPDYETTADPGAGPEEKSFLRQVYAALDRVPTELRLAWTLRVLEEKELEEVARLCGCSLATVKRRVAQAQALVEREVDHG